MKKLVVTPHGKDCWELYKDFEAYGVKVPKGFVTDLASIPKFFWRILPPFGLYSEAAVIHDYLYRCEGLTSYPTKADADNLFYEIMLDSEVKKWKAYAMFKAVRLFGPKW